MDREGDGGQAYSGRDRHGQLRDRFAGVSRGQCHADNTIATLFA